MYVAQHPEMSAKLGLVGAKAQFFSENSWKGYLEIINQLIAVLGVIGFGFITSWVFGREYIEHTLTDILALPVSRSSIVLAKIFSCIILVLGLGHHLVFSGKYNGVIDAYSRLEFISVSQFCI